MAKMVLVISCDTPEEDIGEFVEDALNVVRPVFAEQPNVHTWAGINGSAEAVLNVIGAD